MACHERGSKSGIVRPARYEELSRRGARAFAIRRTTSFSTFRADEPANLPPGKSSPYFSGGRNNGENVVVGPVGRTPVRGHRNYGENEGTKATSVSRDEPE